MSLFAAVYGAQLVVASLAIWGMARGARALFLDAARTAQPMDDLLLRAEVSIDHLRALARIAPPLGFGAAIAVMAAGLGGDAGLVALQRGLAESIALSRGMLSVVTGVTTSLVCRAAANVLSRRLLAMSSEER